MSNRDLLLLGYSRENSKRTIDKMIRQFGDSSLYEIFLDRIEQVSKLDNPFSQIIMAINKNDKVLTSLSKNTNIRIVDRDDNSILQGTEKISDIQHYLSDFDEEYVMVLNGSFPFLKANTIIDAANYFIKHPKIKSLTCVKERHNFFWDNITHEPINNKNPTCMSTTLCPPVLESVQCFVIYNRETMLKEDIYWKCKKNDPYLYKVPDTVEFMDIDTELEFKICDTIWHSINQQ